VVQQWTSSFEEVVLLVSQKKQLQVLDAFVIAEWFDFLASKQSAANTIAKTPVFYTCNEITNVMFFRCAEAQS
jgi:hypothetical protein